MMSIPNNRIALFNLPYPVLRELLRKIDLDDMFKLMNNDTDLMDIVYWHQVPVGPYNLRLNGHPGICVPDKKYLWNSEDTSEVIEMYLDIKAMFPGHLGTVHIDLACFQGSLDFEPMECKNLEVNSSIWGVPDPQLQQKLEDVMKLFRPSESLKLDGMIDVEKIKHLEKIQLGSAEWMTGEDLLKLESKRIHISENQLESEDVNAFLHQWIKGTGNLEILTIHNFTDFQLGDLLRGIPILQFDPKIRSRRFFTPDADTFYNNDSKPILEPADFREGVDMGTAVDIRRKDGLMASVLLKEHQLVVVVWKDRFPVRRILEILEEKVKKEMVKITRNIGWMRKNRKMDLDLAKENVEAHKKVAKLKNKMKNVDN